jgi:N-methylhydantoinase A
MEPARYHFGIDIGGTFTDAVMLEEGSGSLQILKVPTTADDPSRGFLMALDSLMFRDRVEPGHIRRIVHGTTIGTNAIIEGKTARTAFVTTRGFRDLLEIGRQTRPDLYDLFSEKPEPLVPRNLCFEVTERVGPDGRIWTPLSESEIDVVIEAIREQHVESVAVCFLHSYRNPVHEDKIIARIRELCPEIFLSASSRVLREFREYARASTTVVNAALQPIVSRYIARVLDGLETRGVPKVLYVMQSNGGVCSAEVACRLPVSIVESGPAAGVTAAGYIGKRAGFQDLVAFDMGGTTAKAALLQGGRVPISTDFEVGTRAGTAWGSARGRGYPIKMPVLDLVEVGSGGGSIAWVDTEGIIHVGPESAGSDPGPACYGRGGVEPTVTDAHLVLGRLSPEDFAGGSVSLDVDAAWRAIEIKCARRTGLDVVTAARGIVEIANANMAAAIRQVSVQRGLDPRDFALLAFGGAGPLHANDIACELGLPVILIPPFPGVTSAMGLLLADLTHDFVLTMVGPLEDSDPDKIESQFYTLEEEGRATLSREGVENGKMEFLRFFDLRYVGQSYELQVPLPPGRVSKQHIEHVMQRFHLDHKHAYGFAATEEPVELVNLRVRALGHVGISHLPDGMFSSSEHRRSIQERRVYFQESGFIPTRLYWRESLRPGEVVSGPAVVAQVDSTTVVLPGFHAVLDNFGNLMIGRPSALDRIIAESPGRR